MNICTAVLLKLLDFSSQMLETILMHLVLEITGDAPIRDFADYPVSQFFIQIMADTNN